MGRERFMYSKETDGSEARTSSLVVSSKNESASARLRRRLVFLSRKLSTSGQRYKSKKRLLSETYANIRQVAPRENIYN